MTGPPPKRSDHRVRRNKSNEVESLVVEGSVEVPELDPEWHPIARNWFLSLAKSGQSKFYEESDWHTAFYIAEVHLRQMLAVLSTFGTWSRYYRLEEFLDSDGVDSEDDPDRAWEAIETEILRRHPDWIEQLDPKAGGRAFETIAGDITATLDRFARAITRMWTLGALHEEAQTAPWHDQGLPLPARPRARPAHPWPLTTMRAC